MMSRFTQPILFDESIMEWRFRTKADDDYAEAISREVFGEKKETQLDVLLSKLAKSVEPLDKHKGSD